jgi:hypothetical protein
VTPNRPPKHGCTTKQGRHDFSDKPFHHLRSAFIFSPCHVPASHSLFWGYDGGKQAASPWPHTNLTHMIIRLVAQGTHHPCGTPFVRLPLSGGDATDDAARKVFSPNLLLHLRKRRMRSCSSQPSSSGPRPNFLESRLTIIVAIDRQHK